jgi:catechol 2,3-dioxygenase-like lactoylglutathione lyase family enzyme
MVHGRGYAMHHDHRTEIDRNYDFFQRKLGSLLVDHEGEYALIRNKRIVEFFDKPGTAYRSGLSRFPDHLFSVQEVTAEPVELGHMSFVLG